ncbi:YopX family protein [Lacticaseibacillus rhamnosus]|uniref:YopX family protein n=2 Tax=Lacticaseibacillus rhamnosus TaxID=47715 RepID=UPI00237F724D|nr:YopX family protein [Lacticaseibacillus rhamnosus]MDE3301627.1 YopX family protein [Lacticaseibacillus rhamnosus]
MKREIKFRAWNKKDKVMVDVAAMNFGPSGLWSLIEDADDAELQLEDNYELMQYTGLKDKNGREIYEGDIVRTGEDNIGDPDPTIGQVIMREGSWLIENEKKQEEIGLFSEITSREVIGNIFEDNQLLEGKR